MFLFGSWVNICFLFWLPVVPVSLHWYTLVQLSSGFCIFKFGAGKNLTKCGLLSELYCEWGWPGQPQILKSPYPEFASHYLKPALSIFFSLYLHDDVHIVSKESKPLFKIWPFWQTGGSAMTKRKSPFPDAQNGLQITKELFGEKTKGVGGFKNKLASLEATLVRNYHWLTHWQGWGIELLA